MVQQNSNPWDAGVEEETIEEKEYVTIESHTLQDLIRNVQTYSYDSAASHVMTDAEKMVGGHIDFKG